MGELEFRRAAVIGTGWMGPGIAVTLALGGVATTLLSRTEEGAAQGLEKALVQIQTLEDTGLETAGQADGARGRLRALAGWEEAVSEADLVIESGPENMEWKRETFARLDALARTDCVLASNTSGLSITAIASACSRPERVLTTHFWNPPHLMRLVEIVRGEQTEDGVVQAVKRLLAHCQRVPVIVKQDRPGQLGNRLQHALWREAVYIVQEGIAEVEDVDLAAKAGFGFRLPVYGIFEHMDAVGMDLSLAVMDYVARDLYSERRAPQAIFDKVAEGKLGPKTGEGFYDWKKKDLAAVLRRRDEFLIDFLKRYGTPGREETKS